jgi:hypothetical protein
MLDLNEYSEAAKMLYESFARVRERAKDNENGFFRQLKADKYKMKDIKRYKKSRGKFNIIKDKALGDIIEKQKARDAKPKQFNPKDTINQAIKLLKLLRTNID